MILLKRAWLCPGDDNGPHITDDPTQCQCGSTNLVHLEKVIIREKSADVAIQEINASVDKVMARYQ